MNLEITFLTHACLKIKGNFGTFICDPWILNEPVYNFSTWKFPPVRNSPEDIVSDVDYLLITHSHEDHFHVPSLDYFKRDVQIILPEYSDHPSLRAHTVERCLRALGFRNIRKIKPWERFFLGGNTPLTMIPAARSREHDWENCGFVIEHPDCTMINMNDNLNDRALCTEIVARFPKIDIAFVQTAGVTMYPGCFRMSEKEMRTEADKRTHSFADQKRLINWLQPKRVAPFAGDFCWLSDRYFHNNWANRASPLIFREMLQKDYPNRDIELLLFHPSDTWTMEGGLKKNHPEVDWENYLDEIKKVKERFQPKINEIDSWIEKSDRSNLYERSRAYTENVFRNITRDYIFFAARFRICIEGENSNFSFVTKVDYKSGFSIDWSDTGPVDQTLYVREAIWASILDGKLMWNIIQWTAQAEQHVPYREDMGRFWFWMEYHIDLNNKVPQVIIEPVLHPEISERVRPQYGVFNPGGTCEHSEESC